MLNLIYKLFWITAVLLIYSCAKTDSSNIKTDGFYVTYRVVGNNQNSAVCTASFQVGGVTGTYIDLNAGDTVTCDGQSMSRSEFAGIVTYSANVAYQVGKTYNIVLSRAGEGDYTSSVVMPQQIVGYSPSGSTSYQKGSAINVSWTASSNAFDNMKVSLNYNTGTSSYSFYEDDTAPETGSGYGFSSLETQVNPPVAGNWSGSIKFSRFLEGSMDVALEGSVRAGQEVSVNITLTD